MGDTFGTASRLDINGESYRYCSLAKLAALVMVAAASLSA